MWNSLLDYVASEVVPKQKTGVATKATRLGNSSNSTFLRGRQLQHSEIFLSVILRDRAGAPTSLRLLPRRIDGRMSNILICDSRPSPIFSMEPSCTVKAFQEGDHFGAVSAIEGCCLQVSLKAMRYQCPVPTHVHCKKACCQDSWGWFHQTVPGTVTKQSTCG